MKREKKKHSQGFFFGKGNTPRVITKENFNVPSCTCIVLKNLSPHYSNLKILLSSRIGMYTMVLPRGVRYLVGSVFSQICYRTDRDQFSHN